MALGLKTARRIDRDAASQNRVATLGQLSAISKLAKPQVFNLHDFCEGRSIVNFSDGHILRSDARLIVRLQRRAMTNMLLDFFGLSVAAGAELHLQYRHHVEACYCLDGEGEIENLATGARHRIGPGILYALDEHDAHVLRVTRELRLVCVFNPPLAGGETHDAQGGYLPATD